ncbi:ERG4/ERG24 ergosterol biosynthesis protein [Delitschia confertaspora ATCC 74209]|uniref:Delta(14)-sterol reductase n=1 Tax=Delitschia confertaspora ATCC 74209 TaxID=1513339 RepID=A0A9P4MMD6_9PLEO|nr:ERG4/ERG24 ergosterol biosynthesis protein [Delitschia confertaspora ATCC 74209]
MAPNGKASSKVVREKQPHGYEFFGPPGALVISTALPVVCYALAFFCNDISGCPAPSLLHPSTLTLEKLKQEVGWEGFSTLINTKAVLATFGYYLLSLALNTFLPAHEVEGTELRSGGRLKYRLNSFSSAIFILSILAAGTLYQGAEFPVWTFITDNFVPLLTTNILISYALATYVYISSFSVQHPTDPNMRELAAGGHTGNILYDWFIGRELNPRVNIPIFGEVDIKSWMELRPGMLGWIILDFAHIMQQYRNFGRVTDSILLITVAQTIYTFDALYMEPAVLTTIDIISDGFGFMLSFGDLAWLPFTYCIQTRYLANYPVELGWKVLGVFAVQAIGYWIFRSTNNQKNRFRTNPNDPRVKHLKYIQTESGSKLITSGWWGMARHINYLGDWVMSWSYCLPTAVSGYLVDYSLNHPVSPAPADAIFFNKPYGKYVYPGPAKGYGMVFTYFFMVYFAVLLIHRERRDEEKCRRKYGKDWEKYRELVPWRIIPYIY